MYGRFSQIATEALSGRLEHTQHATCMQLNDGLSSKYDVIISNVEMSNNAPDAVAGSHLLMQTVLHYAKNFWVDGKPDLLVQMLLSSCMEALPPLQKASQLSIVPTINST
jgi:hypothetical protein